MSKETRQYTITADKEFLDKFENIFNELIKQPTEEKRPEWQVITYQQQDGKLLYDLEKDGRYHTRDSSTSYSANCFKSCPIISVKRLSDGEIFTIGDVSEKGIIKQFWIDSDIDVIDSDIDVLFAKFEDGKNLQLKFLKKIKPLFVTEDGMGLNDGDPAYWVIFDISVNKWRYQYQLSICENHVKNCLKDKNTYRIFSTMEAAINWVNKNQSKPLFITEDSKELCNKEDKVYSVCPKGTWETRELTAGYLAGYGRIGVHGRPFSNWKHFSTPELRDEYILQNKPVLSYNDIIEFSMVPGIGTWLNPKEIQELQEFVKSKL